MENYEVKYYNYDINEYPFIKMIEGLFEVEDLTKIHDAMKKDIPNTLFTNENDDTTMFHSIFYNKINAGWDSFEEKYKMLINDIAKNILKQNYIIYQTKPNIRIQLPNNIAVGGSKKSMPGKYGWHKDSDDEYNHPPFEMNFIVPLTDATETASIAPRCAAVKVWAMSVTAVSGSTVACVETSATPSFTYNLSWSVA